MADQIIPATLLGLMVTVDEWIGPDGNPASASRVRLHLEAKKSDWEDVEALVGSPGVTLLPEGGGILLDPVSAAVLLKD